MDCAFDEPLHHILNEQGISSPIFPMTKVELNELTVYSLRELLGFYRLSTLGQKPSLINRFSQLIGL